MGGVTLTRPVGGERWIVTTQPGVQADQQEIKWTSAGTIPNVKIEYSRNGGTSWSPVKETEGTANDGIVANDTSFYWNVPDEATIADTCKIRISDSTDPNTVSTLATPFRIIGRLNITYPTVGVDLVTLQTYNVTWTTQGTVSIPRVNLSYSIDGGINWRDMAGVPNQVTNIANTNTYAWNVPNPLTTNTVIKVADPNDATVFNISPVFNVRGFQINSPNGAEEWEFNSTHNVTWTATGTITPPYTYIPFCGRRHDLDILAETVQLRSGAQYFVDVEHKRYR